MGPKGFRLQSDLRGTPRAGLCDPEGRQDGRSRGTPCWDVLMQVCAQLMVSCLATAPEPAVNPPFHCTSHRRHRAGSQLTTGSIVRRLDLRITNPFRAGWGGRRIATAGPSRRALPKSVP